MVEPKEVKQHCPDSVTVWISIFGVPYISLSQIVIEFGMNKLIQLINKLGRITSDYFPER